MLADAELQRRLRSLAGCGRKRYCKSFQCNYTVHSEMNDENKQNLVYFESASMRDLYASMEAWQKENRKRLLSLSIQPNGGRFCSIALTNPTEVVITDMFGKSFVDVESGLLFVDSTKCVR